MEADQIRESDDEVEGEIYLNADDEIEEMFIGPVVRQQAVHDAYCSKGAPLPIPKLQKDEKTKTNVEVSSGEVYDLGRRSLVEDIDNYDLEEQKSHVQDQFNQDSFTAIDVYNRLNQVTFGTDDSNNPGVWASMDEINSYINDKGIKTSANGDQLAYYIGPNNFGFNSIEGINDIAKHICRRDGISNNFYGSKELDKPFIIVSNTETVLAQNPTEVNQCGGFHWISWVLLPKKYVSLTGKVINNDKYQILFFDSLFRKSFPEGLKKFLTEGGVINESTDTGERHISLVPFCKKEEMDFKRVNHLTGQQKNSNDCGWWAIYYALMTVYTGGVEFLEELKGKKLSAEPLRRIMNLQNSTEHSSSNNRQSVQVNNPDNRKQSSDFDGDITPEKELINIINSRDSEKEKLAKIKRCFVKEPKLNINLHDEHNDTLLHISVNNEECTVVEWLLKNGAKIDVENSMGRTPLEVAHKQEIVEILLSHIIQPSL